MKRLGAIAVCALFCACGVSEPGDVRSGTGGMTGSGGEGGAPNAPPVAVDSLCRDFCANEAQGEDCGANECTRFISSCTSGEGGPAQQCYEGCLAEYADRVSPTLAFRNPDAGELYPKPNCPEEWVAWLDCVVNTYTCNDLFGDCDELDPEPIECPYSVAEMQQWCAENCSDDYDVCVELEGRCPPPGPAGTGGTAGVGGMSGSGAACTVPDEAKLEPVDSPDTVIGDGTPESCTSDAFVEAVARGGVIVFDCGPDPIVLTLDRTAKVFNDQNPDVVIDGGGKVTLSGGGRVRILYQNTCDPEQVWTTPHCDDQDHPRLTVQNLTFVDGNAKAEEEGGGAIFVRGGRFKIVNSRFFRNVCEDTGPDVGGGAVRVFDQHQDRPVYVTDSTFGAEGLGNVCANGGALSSIGVSYTVLNSVFSHNRAIGTGANPARPGTPGGGSGGAIYNDGNTFTLRICSSHLSDNHANEGGGAIFFVSNDRSGRLLIQDSVLQRNPSDGFETAGYPGIFVLANGDPEVRDSIIE